MKLTVFIGDGGTFRIPLRFRDPGYTPAGGTVLWTAKLRGEDPDPSAIIQKETLAGAVLVQDNGTWFADIELLEADTLGREPMTLLWDVQVQRAGESPRTGATGELELLRDITRARTASIPINVVQPPILLNGEQLLALEASATTAAADAQASADAAKISETTSVYAAAQAQLSQQAAEDAAEAADASKTAAGLSEASALVHKNAAGLSAAAALASEQAAKTSETASSTSAVTSGTARDQAVTAKDAALAAQAASETARTQAQAAATAAGTSEANALTHKNAAQTAANTATTKATEAANSASAAAASAQAASDTLASKATLGAAANFTTITTTGGMTVASASAGEYSLDGATATTRRIRFKDGGTTRFSIIHDAGGTLWIARYAADGTYQSGLVTFNPDGSTAFNGPVSFPGTVTGELHASTIKGAGAVTSAGGNFFCDASANTGKSYYFQSGGGTDWRIIDEGGVPNLSIWRYIAGVFQDKPFSISNSTGAATLTGAANLNGGSWSGAGVAKAFNGSFGANPDVGAIWAHHSFAASTNGFALMQESDGSTHLNSSPSKALRLRQGLSTKLVVNTDGTVAIPPATTFSDVVNVAGALNANGGAKIGSSGATIASVLTAVATLDFPSIAAGTHASLTVTVTGAQLGASVHLGLPSSVEPGVVFQGFVSTGNTVAIRASNVTGAAIDPASASFRVTVFNF